MFLSELFIIYLAAAAPFGVSQFFSEQSAGASTSSALFRATTSALVWPFTSLPRLLRRLFSLREAGARALEGRAPDEQRVEQVKRAAVNALCVVEDLLEDACALRSEASRHTLFAARECVERYAGLALACVNSQADARPTPREMELCRIAGRGGDDLLVAGRCVHRRNVTRLVAHRERASIELAAALASVGAAAHQLYTPARPSHSEKQLRAADARRIPAGAIQISEALARALSRVAELLSLFDDRATLVTVARMLEAECALVSRDETAATRYGESQGEESCTTQAAHTAFASPRLRTTTSHGG